MNVTSFYHEKPQARSGSAVTIFSPEIIRLAQFIAYFWQHLVDIYTLEDHGYKIQLRCCSEVSFARCQWLPVCMRFAVAKTLCDWSCFIFARSIEFYNHGFSFLPWETARTKYSVTSLCVSLVRYKLLDAVHAVCTWCNITVVITRNFAIFKKSVYFIYIIVYLSKFSILRTLQESSPPFCFHAQTLLLRERRHIVRQFFCSHCNVILAMHLFVIPSSPYPFSSPSTKFAVPPRRFLLDSWETDKLFTFGWGSLHKVH